MMGRAIARGEYADICSAEWIGRLHSRLAPEFARFAIEDFDASVLQQTAPRLLTQRISGLVFAEGFDGIYYRSKYGHDLENWALFEPFKIEVTGTEALQPDDPDLQRALFLLQLRIGD